MLVNKLRLQRGWSQEQLAELSGLSVRTIQRIERGQPTSPESLKCLASVFEIDFTELREPTMNTATTHRSVSADEALAMAHVRRVKGLYMHIAQYCAVMLVLGLVNVLAYPRHPWALWVALAWGAGVLVHALRAYDRIPFLNGKWEQQQVEKYLGRKL